MTVRAVREPLKDTVGAGAGDFLQGVLGVSPNYFQVPPSMGDLGG